MFLKGQASVDPDSSRAKNNCDYHANNCAGSGLSCVHVIELCILGNNFRLQQLLQIRQPHKIYNRVLASDQLRDRTLALKQFRRDGSAV